MASVLGVANWLVDGPRNVVANVDALSDSLKLAQRINEIFKPFIDLFPLRQMCKAFSAITDFVSARKCIDRIGDILSGSRALIPNLLKIASKCAYLVGDIASTARWLSSIHILGAWVKNSTAQLVTWGKEFNVLKGIGDVSCITGALLDIADTIRQMVYEAAHMELFTSARHRMSVFAGRVLDLAYDITKVAAAVFYNIPGVPILLTTVSLALGNILSLTKFFVKKHCPYIPAPLVGGGEGEVAEVGDDRWPPGGGEGAVAVAARSSNDRRPPGGGEVLAAAAAAATPPNDGCVCRSCLGC
jgi:hypothetical protein